MTNAFFDKARQAFTAAQINYPSDTIRAILVRTSGGGAGPYWTPDMAADEFLDDIPDNADCRPLGTGASTGPALASKTNTDGVLDADDVDFGLVASGDVIQTIVIYKDTGSQATSRVITKHDSGTGLPVTPDGGNLTSQWSSGADKIGKL